MKSNKNLHHSSHYELNQCVSESTLALGSLTKVSGYRMSNAPVQIPDQKMDLVNGDIPEHRFVQAESFHQLYREQSKGRMETLQSLYKELGEPTNLVIMFFCKNYFPLFKNWLLSCELNGLNPREKLIVFCLDNESAQNCKTLGIKYYLLDPEIYIKAGGAGSFADEHFRITMLYKNAIILDALELGASILFQDVDLIWFKDPFAHLDSHGEYYDIQIMYDGPSPRYKPIYCNSGFIYIRPNNVSKALFETALRNSACILKSGGHQYALVRILNYFLNNQLIRLHILPEHLFMNGHLFNTNGGIRPSAKNWRNHGIVFHYSWTKNIKQKFEKLHKFGMCFLDSEDAPFSNSTDNPCDSKQKTQIASKSKDMNKNEITLTLHIAGQEPLELICKIDDPILQTLFQAFSSSESRDGKNSLVHLRVMEDEKPCDIFIRASEIKLIKTTPPLKIEFLNENESISYNPSK